MLTLIIAYYKICSGYIFICDVDREDSIEYMIKHIEKAINSKLINKSQSFIIINKRKDSNTVNIATPSNNNLPSINNRKNTEFMKKEQENRNKNIEIINRISAQYDIKSTAFDLNALSLQFTNNKKDSNKDFSCNQQEFESFFSSLLL